MNDWRDLALCREVGGEIFFPEKREPTRDAKAVCRRCEVRGPCLEDALARDDRFGVLGGMTARERRKLKRRAA
jgi:WhiB family redox-sensing transcriptional regulator